MLVSRMHIGSPRSRLVVPDRALAGGRFGSYKPSTETPQQVRQPLVTGDELQRLRDVRAMLRDMTPEQAYHAIEWVRANLTFFEAVALAKAEGKLIVPNLVVDRMLQPNKTLLKIPQLCTGTVIIYEKPNQPFADEVAFGGIRFSVPEQFSGKRNCALVVEHPDFDLVKHGNRYVLIVPDERNLHFIKMFPKQGNWHQPDCTFGIPQGVKSLSDGSRYLSRVAGSYLGPAARGDNLLDVDGQFVNLNVRSSDRFGVGLI